MFGTRDYTVNLPAGRTTIRSAELDNFASRYGGGIGQDLGPRIADLFWLDLHVHAEHMGVAPPQVLQEIFALEGSRSGVGTKPPSEFQRAPLKGLWHKHFFSAHFLAHNVLAALPKGDDFKRLADEIRETHPQASPAELAHHFAHRVTTVAIEDKADAGRLTGEWLIFAKHGGQNYYLALNRHESGDQFIADRIAKHCSAQFPFLAEVLGSPPSDYRHS